LGCDIHVYAEVKTGKKWEVIKGACGECRGTGEDRETIPTCSKCKFTEAEHVGGKCLFDPGHATKFKHAICWGCEGQKIIPTRFGGGRDYELFGKLSDVRGNGPRIDACGDGVPSDSDPLLVRAADGSDWHTHTHAMLDELLAVDWSDHADWRRTLKALKKLGPPDKTRVVWWYDN
jgi:hypothetical protein